MTREEAINEWIIPAIKNTWNEKKCKEIIKALEQEPGEDYISRSEAIKMFKYNYKGERIPDYDCDNFPVQIAIKTVKEMLRGLPPVTSAEKQEPCELCKEDLSIITVPDGATNGDMIKALFGEPTKISEKSGVLYKFMYRNGRSMFSTFYDCNWWNSSYRKEQG